LKCQYECMVAKNSGLDILIWQSLTVTTFFFILSAAPTRRNHARKRGGNSQH
jgi:hypothetical protein